MVRIIVRPPTGEDVLWLADNMRPMDALEAREVSGEDLALSLFQALLRSYRAYAAERSGRLLALFGTTPLDMLAGQGCLWMLATEEVYRTPGMLTRLARAHIQEVSGLFPVLINWVHQDNTASLRWLEWLGATIDEPAPFGQHGLPFRRFEIRADHVR